MLVWKFGPVRVLVWRRPATTSFAVQIRSLGVLALSHCGREAWYFVAGSNCRSFAVFLDTGCAAEE